MTAEFIINLIKVDTAQIVFSAYGKGVVEKELSSFSVWEVSGRYDQSLAGDSLRAALSRSVEMIIRYFHDHPWVLTIELIIREGQNRL